MRASIRSCTTVSPGYCEYTPNAMVCEMDVKFSCTRFAFLSENNIKDVIDSTFSVENNSFGVVKVHELKPNGATVTVTEANKKEYVKLYVNYRFMRGIEQQFLALQRGTSGRFYSFDEGLIICV